VCACAYAPQISNPIFCIDSQTLPAPVTTFACFAYTPQRAFILSLHSGLAGSYLIWLPSELVGSSLICLHSGLVGSSLICWHSGLVGSSLICLPVCLWFAGSANKKVQGPPCFSSLSHCKCCRSFVRYTKTLRCKHKQTHPHS